MRALIIFAILATLGIVGLRFRSDRDWKKLLISIGLFAIVLSAAGAGGVMRSVIPLFIAHSILVLVAWSALAVYVLRGKLYLPLIFSPIATILLFLILEYIVGSAGAGE